jgi:hypothetical protein
MIAGAGDPVVAVGVVAGDPAELVAGEFGGLGVVGGGLAGGGVAGQRPESGQRSERGRAVEVPVGDDGAVVGAAGAAVGRVQVLDQLRAGQAERDGPGGGVAVGVAGVGQDVAERDAVAGHLGQHRDQGAGRVAAAGAGGHPAGQLGDGRAVLAAHHGGGGGVLAVEHLAVLAGAAAGAVPTGRLGVGAGAGAAGRRAGEGLHVGPVDGQRRAGVLELTRGCWLPAGRRRGTGRPHSAVPTRASSCRWMPSAFSVWCCCSCSRRASSHEWRACSSSPRAR